VNVQQRWQSIYDRVFQLLTTEFVQQYLVSGFAGSDSHAPPTLQANQASGIEAAPH
jgi:hypothetical protein